MVDGEPYVSFFDNFKDSNLKRLRKIPDKALVEVDQVRRVLTPPKTEFRGREAYLKLG